MTDAGMKLLKLQLMLHEDVRRSAYQDSRGYWTIGVGRLIDARKGGGLRDVEIAFLLENDIAEKMADLDRELPWWRRLDEVRQRVLVDMAFNLGISGLLSFKQALAAVKEGRYDDAAAALLNSAWASQVKTRATRLAQMMRTGLNP